MLGTALTWDAVMEQATGFASVEGVVFMVTVTIGVPLAVFIVRKIQSLMESVG